MATVKEIDNKLVKCIHGLYWSTCAICKEKTFEEVQLEKSYITESIEASSAFDYQEPTTLDSAEDDRDYDIDDMQPS